MHILKLCLHISGQQKHICKLLQLFLLLWGVFASFKKNRPILSSLLLRLAIYYLNSVSEAYQNSNMELKKKMQMVNTERTSTFTHSVTRFISTSVNISCKKRND